MNTSFANLNKIKEKEKSLKLIQQEKDALHPLNEGFKIYATIGVKEIKEGLTEEDFK